MKIFNEAGDIIGEYEFDANNILQLVNHPVPETVRTAKSVEETMFEAMAKNLSEFVIDLCDARNINKTGIILKLPKAVRGILEVLDEFIKNPEIVEDGK